MKVSIRIDDECMRSVVNDFESDEVDWLDLRDYSFEVDIIFSAGMAEVSLSSVPLFKTIDDMLDGLFYSLVTGKSVTVESVDFEPLVDMAVHDGMVELRTSEGCVKGDYVECVHGLGKSLVSLVECVYETVPALNQSKLIPTMGSLSMTLFARIKQIKAN